MIRSMPSSTKFPRTIRLDTSDVYVFEHAAEPGEWAVPGSFAFANCEIEELVGKARQAFGCGWLGTLSWGFSSLVEVAPIDEQDFAQVVGRLAHHFVVHFGAPDHRAALPAAEAEARAAAELCEEHALNRLLALERQCETAGIVERFRVIQPERAADHARLWSIEPDEDDQKDV